MPELESDQVVVNGESIQRASGGFFTSDLSTGGKQLAGQSQEVLADAIKTATLFPEMDIAYPDRYMYEWTTMSRPTDSNIIMDAEGTEGTTNTNFVSPVLAKVEVTCYKRKTAIEIGYEAMAKAVQGEGLVPLFIDEIRDNIIPDWEMILWRGDTGGSAPYTRYDGILKTAAAANTSTFGADFDPDTHLVWLINKIPARVRSKYKGQFKFYCPPEIIQLYLQYLSEKHPSSDIVSQIAINGVETPAFRGFPLVENQNMTDSTTMGPIVFCYPKNFKLAIYQQVKMSNPAQSWREDLDVYRIYFRWYEGFSPMFDTHFAVAKDVHYAKGWS